MVSSTKRARKAPVKFEDNAEGKPRLSKIETSDESPKEEVHWPARSFIAVRNESDGFYICQCLEDVAGAMTSFRARWMERQENDSSCYYAGANEDIEVDSTLDIDIRLTRKSRDVWKLVKAVQRKIENALDHSLGKVVDEPAPKKSRSSSKVKKEKKVKPAKKSAKDGVKGKRAKKAKKVKEDKVEKPKKVILTPAQIANPNLLLVPNNRIDQWEKNQFLESKAAVPFISTLVSSKLLMRAVTLGDMKMLQQMVDDIKHVSNLNIAYSVASKTTPMQIAITKRNKRALQLIIKGAKPNLEKKRVQAVPGLISHATGHYNSRSLNVPVINRLTLSRGSKEGNNALTKDLDARHSPRTGGRHFYIECLYQGVPLKFINEAAKECGMDDGQKEWELYNYVFIAIRQGHRKLAADLLAEMEKSAMTTFGFLHKEVMGFDNENLRKIQARSVLKKTYNNCEMRPLHCAAINPNPKYLSKLLAISPELNIPDADNRRPIHYAAACEGTLTLQLLMDRGCSVNDADNKGHTPLMIACQTGRPHNVKFLLERAKRVIEEAEAEKVRKEGSKAKLVKKGSRKRKLSESEDDNGGDDDDEEEEDAPVMDAYGIGGVNRSITIVSKFYTYTAVFFAVHHGHLECVQELINADVNVDLNKTLGPSRQKTTPLMLAASRGHLDIVKLLVKHKATVEFKDRQKRTALFHAVMNGHSHIASYLLRAGASPLAADSSGNTLMHYAAAYGWFFCVQLLMQAGAPIDEPNDWKTTPAGISFLKGNTGLTNFLLKQKGVDINFRNEKGMTLVAIACASPLVKDLYDHVKYLIEETKADCRIVDGDMNTMMHHLARNSVYSEYNQDLIEEDKVEISLDIAKLLLKHGIELNIANAQGQTPVILAIEQRNIKLLTYLIENGGTVSEVTDSKDSNVLHMMANMCMKKSLHAVIKIIDDKSKKDKSHNLLSDLAKHIDDHGCTPFIAACETYHQCNGKFDDSGENEDEDDDDDDDDDDDEDEYDDDDDDESKKKGKSPRKSLIDTTKVVSDSTALGWSNGLKLIRYLIDLCNSDLTILKQHKQGALKHDTDKAKHVSYSCVHYLIAPNEPPITNSEGKVIDPCPGLSMILRYNPPLDTLNDDGETPLIYAIKTGKNEHAIKLIEAGADVNISGKDKECGTAAPLIIASAYCGGSQLILALITNGADLNARCTKRKFTALHYLVQNKDAGQQPEIKKSLVHLMRRMSVDQVNATDDRKMTPLHVSVAANLTHAKGSFSEVEAYLISEGAKLVMCDNDGRLPLHYAFCRKYISHHALSCDPIDLVTTLTEGMSSKEIDIRDHQNRTPLHYAASRNATVCAMHLLEHGADVAATDDLGNTPLAYSVLYAHESCTLLLIQRDSNVDANIMTISPKVQEIQNMDLKNQKILDNNCDKPSDEVIHEQQQPWRWLHFEKQHEMPCEKLPLIEIAIKNKWSGIVYVLLDRLKAAGVTVHDTIEVALKCNDFNLAMTLIRRAKGKNSLCGLNAGDQTLLHVLALHAEPDNCRELQVNVANDLLDNSSIKVDAVDKHNCSALHYAALRHNSVMVLYLLNRGADVSRVDSFNHRPLSAALLYMTNRSYICLDVVRDLIHRGAALNQLNAYPSVDYTTFDYSPKVLTCYNDFKREYFNDKHTKLLTPLCVAVTQRDLDMCEFLLGKGADVNATDGHQMTPLMHAVKVNDLSIVKLLLNGEAVANNAVAPVHYGRRGVAKKRFVLSRARTDDDDEDDDEEEEDEDEENSGEDEDADESDDYDSDNEADVSKRVLKHTKPIDVKIEFKADKKFLSKLKTKANLNLADKKGRTVIHHVVLGNDAGGVKFSYDNVQMLVLLHKAGASLSMKDKSNNTALKYALDNGCEQLAKAIQKINRVQISKWATPSFDDFKKCAPRPQLSRLAFDYDKDSMTFLKNAKRPAPMDVDKEPTPDPQSDMASSGKILYDPDEGVDRHFSVLLSKVDVRKAPWGLYNFYRLQLIFEKGRDLYTVFTRWGRIGDEGQHQCTPFQKCTDAQKEFRKIFKQKTGNDWTKFHTFEKKSGKYAIVLNEDTHHLPNIQELDLSLKSKVPSKLPPVVQQIFKQFTNVESMCFAAKQFGLNTQQMAFGDISEDALVKAKEILTEMRPLTMKFSKNYSKTDKREECSEMAEKIAELTSEYYQIVPQYGYEYVKVTPLSDPDQLITQTRFIDNLLELHVASKILTGAHFRSAECNCLDYAYASVKCGVEKMDYDDMETQMLLKFVENRKNKHISIEGIYRLEREGEEARFKQSKLENHRLLFHGTQATNVLSVLARGLLISPAGSTFRGAAFGTGVYFSDSFDKSANYCHTYSDKASASKFMFIAEVALGNMQHLNNYRYTNILEKLLKTNYHSRHIQGRYVPDPAYNIRMQNGVLLPVGKMAQPDQEYVVQDSEYIAYDERQICLRYLVQFHDDQT